VWAVVPKDPITGDEAEAAARPAGGLDLLPVPQKEQAEHLHHPQWLAREVSEQNGAHDLYLKSPDLPEVQGTRDVAPACAWAPCEDADRLELPS
jgi:hypothetical protein